jgi:hypothetical protein
MLLLPIAPHDITRLMRPHHIGEATGDAHRIFGECRAGKFQLSRFAPSRVHSANMLGVAQHSRPRCCWQLPETRNASAADLLEIGTVSKLVDEPSHRIGVNPQESGRTALVPL